MHILRIGLEGHPIETFKQFHGVFKWEGPKNGTKMGSDGKLSYYGLPSKAYWNGEGHEEIRKRGYLSVIDEASGGIIYEGAISSMGGFEDHAGCLSFLLNPKI